MPSSMVPQVQSARSSVDAEVRLLVMPQEESERLMAQYPEQEDLILQNILAQYNLDKSGRRLNDTHVEDDDSDAMSVQRDLIVQALTRKADESFAALSFAVCMGYVVEVKRLLRRGADANGLNYDQRSALHMAAFEGNTHIVEALLEHGADKDGRNRWQRTPLAEAVHANQPHVVQLLLKHGCSLLLDDPAGSMCNYASSGDDGNLLLLLNNGVDPNLGDYDSRTALHIAAAEGHDQIAELLMRFKADPNIRDR